jgi:hypothetical protein
MHGENLNFQPTATYQWGSPIGQQPGMEGFTATGRNAGAAHNRRVTEAAKLYASVMRGKEDPFFLREAIHPTNAFAKRYLAEKYPALFAGDPNMFGLRETMSVTDYQALYVDVLDRMYYGYYNTYPIVNKGLVKQHTLRDFRVVSRYLLDGAVTPFLPAGAANSSSTVGGDAAAPAQQRALLGPVPQTGSTQPNSNTGPIQYQPELYEAKTAVNWRAFVNDDLGIFQDLSNRLAISGNRGISKSITKFFFDANGPNASLYKAGYGNLITTAYGAASSNPVLGVQGLSDGLKILAGMKDSTGDPILITGRIKLVYGPALEVTANNLMNQLSVFLSNEGGGQAGSTGFPAQFLQVNNWLVRNMDLVMDPYIPIVVTNGSRGNTSWALVVDPDTQNRPCVEFGVLQGYETPQIFSKVPNTQRVGGAIDAMLGDFYSMDQELKIIGVYGGTQIDGRSTVASNGTGS